MSVYKKHPRMVTTDVGHAAMQWNLQYKLFFLMLHIGCVDGTSKEFYPEMFTIGELISGFKKLL